MVKAQSKLEQFRTGTDWTAQHARLCLPALMSWIEAYKDSDEAGEFTYKDLAEAIGRPNHWHPLHKALGLLGFALMELKSKELGDIPHIQLAVWSKGQGSPGDNAFNFLGIKKDELKSWPTDRRKREARDVRRKVLEYQHWRKVLRELGLKPRKLNLPSVNEVIVSAGDLRNGGGEKPAHLRLKKYLALNCEALGLEAGYTPLLEQPLLSGDRVDLILDKASINDRVCVEVKSHISNEEDVIRGLFQCTKYRAVLLAQEIYEQERSEFSGPEYSMKAVRVILATECKLGKSLDALANRLGVPVVHVRVPQSFQIDIKSDLVVGGSNEKPLSPLSHNHALR